LIIRRLIVPLAVALVTAHAGQVLAQGAFPAPLPNGAVAPANDPAFPPVRGAAPANDPAFPPVRGAGSANDPAFPPVRRAGTANDPAFPPVNGAAPQRSSFPVNGAAPLTGAGFGPAPAPPSAPGQGPQNTAVMQACMKEFLPLREDAEKKGKLLRAASDKHATAEEACKLIKNYGVAESKMISYIEGHSSKCGIPPQIGEQLKTGHKNTENMQQKVCAVAQQAQARTAGPSLSDMLGSSTALPEATPTKKGGSTFDTLNGNVLSR
jgi:hypothetical protein